MLAFKLPQTILSRFFDSIDITMDPNTAEYHILQHPFNPVHNTDYVTGSDKAWARHYKPMKNITVHSLVDNQGITQANFDNAFFALCDDDRVRMNEPASPPNARRWRFEMEADCENWFHSEISNVVLAAWARFPSVLQSSHIKPLTEEKIPENVDVTYSVKLGQRRFPLAIGEVKRNLIDADDWREGGALESNIRQQKLSRELRGYAHKYRCPQVFCFDGETLLILQLRATRLADLEDERCPIDCWVLPRTTSYFTLRFGLYRLLVQGWRRCQVDMHTQVTVGSLTSHSRQFYNGWPIWKVNGVNYLDHPEGYQRTVDAATGALKWTHEEDSQEAAETGPFW